MSIFNNSKYTKWYFAITNSANTKSREEYTENHHIIPKCLGGGDDKNNLVRLTAREHFVCHWLLTKMTSGVEQRKLAFALNSFRRASKNQKRYMTSRQYEIVRKIVSEARSKSLIGNKFGLGKSRGPMSEGTRAKISAANTGRKLSESQKKQISEFHKGKILSEETKQKMRKPKSLEHAEKISKARTGTTMSAETKSKISKARKGKDIPKTQCPHCLRAFDPGNYKKSHGDKCKMNLSATSSF